MSRLRGHPGERALAARVAITVIAIKLGLRWVALPTLMRWLTPRRRSKSRDPDVLEREIRYTNATLCRLPGRGRLACLPRSLALYRLARLRGIEARLHCGVRRQGDGIIGHAWVTVDGAALLATDDDGAEWKETFTYPPKRPVVAC
jgi:hypothetical protein